MKRPMSPKEGDGRAKDDLNKMTRSVQSRDYSQHFGPFLSPTEYSIKILPVLSLDNVLATVFTPNAEYFHCLFPTL